MAVVDTPEAEVAVQGPAVATSPVEQDSALVDQGSVVVRSMEELAASSNVTMQIGTVIGTGTMAISSTIGSLFLTRLSGLDWIPGIILTTITMPTAPRIIADTIHIRCR